MHCRAWLIAVVLPLQFARAEVVENAELLLEVSPETGSIVRLLDKRDGTEYVIDRSQARLFELQIPDASNYSRRIASWTQRPASVKRTGLGIEVRYTRLRPDTEQYRFGSGLMHFDEPDLDVEARVALQLQVDHIEARLQIVNRSGVPITGVVFPYLGGLNPEAHGTKAAVVLPSSGQRVFRSTSGALSGQRANRYPALLAASWLDYDFTTSSLGIELRSGLEAQDAYFALNPGPFRPGSAYRGRYAYPFIAWIQYPHIEGRGTWISPQALVHVHAGDWHTVAREHREWFRAATPPRSVDRWSGDLGFATFRLKHDDDTIDWSYRDVDRLAQTARSAGFRRIVIEGWRAREGVRNPAPFGEIADPRLGGAEQLRSVVDELERRDTQLLFAFHPAVLNVLRGTPPEQIAFWPVKTRRMGNQLPVDFLYHTSDVPQSLQGPTYRLEIDPASAATRFLLDEAVRLRDDYGFRHLLLKGVGQRAFLSYNRHTGATPQSTYVTGYAKLLGGLREIYGDGLLLNEGINDLVDRYGDGAYTWNQSQDPAVLAYSVPWTAFSNDVEALDYAAVNTAFVHKMLANLVVDGGAGTVDEYPEFAAHLQALQALKAATREYYGDAEFRDHDGLKSVASDNGIVTAVFVHPTRAASSIVVANLTDAPAVARFELSPQPAPTTARVYPDTSRTVELAGPVELALAAHEVRLVAIDARLTR